MSRNRQEAVTTCYIDEGLDFPRLAEKVGAEAASSIVDFRTFLGHHPRPKPDTTGGAICDCGVPMKLVEGKAKAQPNPECPCPCHVDGYVTGER